MRPLMLALAIVTWAPSALAEEAQSRPSEQDAPATEPAKENGIYADLGLGVIGLGYERVLGDTVALNLTAHYYRPWYVSDHIFGFGGEVRAFLFLTGTAPTGPYFSSSARLDYARANLDSGETLEGTAWGVRATLGYGFALSDALNLRVGFGVQSHASRVDDRTPSEHDFSGAYPTVDFLIGFVF